jgi:hypothetical protein
MEIRLKLNGKTITQSIMDNGVEVKSYCKKFNSDVEARTFMSRQTFHTWQLNTTPEEYEEFINWIYTEKKGK